MKQEPAISVVVDIIIDRKTESYKTKSYMQVSEEFSKDDDQDLPRDVILALVYELELMLTRITKRADVTDEEIAKYISERKIVGSDTPDGKPVDYIKKKDSIDRSIDHLFDEDENEDSSNS